MLMTALPPSFLARCCSAITAPEEGPFAGLQVRPGKGVCLLVGRPLAKDPRNVRVPLSAEEQSYAGVQLGLRRGRLQRLPDRIKMLLVASSSRQWNGTESRKQNGVSQHLHRIFPQPMERFHKRNACAFSNVETPARG